MNIAENNSLSQDVVLQGLPYHVKMDHRPWGYFKEYDVDGQVVTGAVLTLKPQTAAVFSPSLAERLWVVLDDGLSVTIQDQRHDFGQNDEIFIPSGVKYQAMAGAVAVRVLEIVFDEKTNVEEPFPYVFPPQKRIANTGWGSYDLITQGQLATLKIITVNPSSRLSLQVHKRRSEWWRLLDDELDVVLGDPSHIVRLHKGDDIYVPVATMHRMVGLKTPVRVLELWINTDPASPTDEADNERLQDDYQRKTESNGDNSAAG